MYMMTRTYMLHESQTEREGKSGRGSINGRRQDRSKCHSTRNNARDKTEAKRQPTVRCV